MLADGILTISGQNISYWSNFSKANEMSPVYFILAFLHPIFYILGAIIWFVFLYYLFKNLKKPYNIILACTFIAGNTWGSASWINHLLENLNVMIITNRLTIITSWFILAAYFLIVGIAAGLSFLEYFSKYPKK